MAIKEGDTSEATVTFRRPEEVKAVESSFPALRTVIEHGANPFNLTAGTEPVSYGARNGSTGGSRGNRANG